MNGSLKNNFNGSYKITEKVSDTVFKYTMTDYTGLGIPATAPTGEMFIGKVSSHYVAISSVSKLGTGPYTPLQTLASVHNGS